MNSMTLTISVRMMADRQLLMCIYRKPEIKEQFNDFMNNDLNVAPVGYSQSRIDEEYSIVVTLMINIASNHIIVQCILLL